MPKPHARFLLRASALLIVLLMVWWFVLLNPLLLLLRGSANMVGSVIFGGNSPRFIGERPSGEWSFRVPMELAIANPEGAGPTKFDSIDVDLERSDVIGFTFSLPVFWAIMVAAPGIRRHLRPLFLGTILVVALETVLFLLFVEIFAPTLAAQVSHSQADFAKWCLRSGYYLVVNAIPYAAPFLIALALHRELRGQILQPGNAGLLQAPRAPAKPSPRRKKARSRRVEPVLRP